MSYFEKAKWYYDNGYCTADQLRTWVKYEKITADQYKTITGIDYVA